MATIEVLVKAEKKEKTTFEILAERKLLAQQVIDRTIYYSDKYKKALLKLNRKFSMPNDAQSTYLLNKTA